ncbi:MBL fold metallo-hydrolase [Chloroflexota bacterium]
MQQITDNIYVDTERRGCNFGFVVTKDGVVVIDTPQVPSDAVQWRDDITKHGPVRHVIITEPHNDHFSGSYYFNGTVISHEGTRETIITKKKQEYEQRLMQIAPECLPLPEGFTFRIPSITLSQRLTLYVGEHTFQLINMPGHTPYQVAVYIPEERVVFTSDNVFHKLQAFLYQALPYEWLESLERLKEIDADVLIPGHGSVCDKNYIPEMSGFIQDWIDTISAAIEKGINLEDAQKTISFLDRYPMQAGSESKAQQVQHANVARLYEVLKK